MSETIATRICGYQCVAGERDYSRCRRGRWRSAPVRRGRRRPRCSCGRASGLHRAGRGRRRRSYFSAAEIDRGARLPPTPAGARYGAVVAVELAALALLVVRPPRALRGAGAATGRRRGAGRRRLRRRAGTRRRCRSTALARRRAIAVGLVTQSLARVGRRPGQVDRDRVRADRGRRSRGRRRADPPLPARLVAARRRARSVAVGAAFVSLAPVVLDPVFNNFEPLPEGRDALRRARAARAAPGSTSARSTRSTPAADDRGQRVRDRPRADQTRRALRHAARRLHPRRGPRLVVAHELAHVRHRDVPRGLLYAALVAPGRRCCAVQRLADRCPRGARAARERSPRWRLPRPSWPRRSA